MSGGSIEVALALDDEALPDVIARDHQAGRVDHLTTHSHNPSQEEARSKATCHHQEMRDER